MKKSSVKVLLGLLAIVLVVYSCTKEETFTPTPDVTNNEEVAQLITYTQGEPIADQYIVVFKKGAFASTDVNSTNFKDAKLGMTNNAKTLLESNNITNKEIKQSYVKTIQGMAVTLNKEELETLRKDTRVDYIEQDQMIHVSMGGPPGGGGGGGSTGQSTPWGITRVNGVADGTGNGTAWIIDSGIDLDHEDLNVDVARSRSFLSGGGGSQSPDDQNGHGTHVAGTVAALNNSVGVIGVAPGAPVVSVRVLDRRGSGSNSGVIAGVDYVGANAASGDAANMSLGGGVSTALDQAVVNASSACPFVLAAGNESDNANNHSPARANGPNIYTVSSMAQGDNWSSFSNYANPPVDYCAPGSSVASTYKSGGYATLSGTSMAAPHVCGIILLGNISTDGTVNGDPDNSPDPIAVH